MKTFKGIALAAATLVAFAAIFGAAGCNKKKDPFEGYENQLKNLDSKISLNVWTYYNNEQITAFGNIISEFNGTVGQKKHIFVESKNYTSPSELANKLEASASKEVGADKMPEIFQSYSDDLKHLDDKHHNVAALDAYFTDEEKANYVNNFWAEGFINGAQRLVPTAKSTEVFMLNKTYWDRFESDYNASAADADKVGIESLSTVEGITQTAEKYYAWSGGKAFFGRDSLGNYFLTSARALDKTIFEKDGDDKIKITLDKETFRRIYDNFYLPYVKGHFFAKERFRSGDVKSGDLLAYVGSTSSAGYFPSSVQISDTSSETIESYVSPLPVFKDGKKVAIQQGAGFAVSKGDSLTEYASVVFLKYLSQNLNFAASMDYLPVLKTDYKNNGLELLQSAVIENAWNQYLKNENKEEKDFSAAQITELKGKLREKKKVTLNTYAATYQTINHYEMWASVPFEESAKARKILEYSLVGSKPTGLGLENLKNADDLVKLVDERVKGGESRADAAKAELAAYNFDAWYADLSSILNTILKQS